MKIVIFMQKILSKKIIMRKNSLSLEMLTNSHGNGISVFSWENLQLKFRKYL